MQAPGPSHSYARAAELARRLERRARQAGQHQPNLFDTYLVLYEIGQRNGWPMNKITAAIVTAGYSSLKVAHRLGSSAVDAISQFATK